jgi:hypothetical protein
MFAMLHGAWPPPPESAAGGVRARVEAAVRAQLDAGLGLLTDGLSAGRTRRRPSSRRSCGGYRS